MAHTKGPELSGLSGASDYQISLNPELLGVWDQERTFLILWVLEGMQSGRCCLGGVQSMPGVLAFRNASCLVAPGWPLNFFASPVLTEME